MGHAFAARALGQPASGQRHYIQSLACESRSHAPFQKARLSDSEVLRLGQPTLPDAGLGHFTFCRGSTGMGRLLGLALASEASLLFGLANRGAQRHHFQRSASDTDLRIAFLKA